MNTTFCSILVTEVPAYADLQRQMHDALLVQNPEWIEPNGDSPKCREYDRRLAELLGECLPGWRVCQRAAWKP